MSQCIELSSGSVHPLAVPAESCPGFIVLDPAEYRAVLDAQTNFGWNLEAFEVAFGAGLMIFATGFGIGLIVQAIRRARTL